MVDENSFNGDFIWTVGGVQVLVGRSSIGKFTLLGRPWRRLGVCRCLSLNYALIYTPGYANVIAADSSFKV